MQKLLILAGLASMAGLAAPSAFEKYRESLLHGNVEAMDSAPRIVEAATGGKSGSAAAPASSGRSVEIAANASGHFSTEARINGRSVPVLVDTGATLVALDEPTARRLGIALQPSDFTARVMTANGEAAAARATISRLKVGAVEMSDVEALVTRKGTLPVTLLGMSFLKRLDGYEVVGDTLQLRQ